MVVRESRVDRKACWKQWERNQQQLQAAPTRKDNIYGEMLQQAIEMYRVCKIEEAFNENGINPST